MVQEAEIGPGDLEKKKKNRPAILFQVSGAWSMGSLLEISNMDILFLMDFAV